MRAGVHLCEASTAIRARARTRSSTRVHARRMNVISSSGLNRTRARERANAAMRSQHL